MFDWLKRKPAPTRLAQLLASYPALTPPHLGNTGSLPRSGRPVLTLKQCRENYRVFRDAMPDRLRLLGGVLDALGVEVAQAYGDPDAFVRRLHETLLVELPPLHRPDLSTFDAWEMSTRDGPHIVLTFMADLAMLEADVLMRAKPGCFVGLNLDPGDREMLFWRRPCLLGLTDRLFPGIQNIYCLEEEWFGIYKNMDVPARFTRPDRIMPITLDGVIGGALLQRLDRDVVDPDLDGKLRTTWLSQAQEV